MKFVRKTALGIGLSLLLAGCTTKWPTFFGSSAPLAKKEEQLFWISHALSVPTFFVVAGLLFYILIRFRKRPGREGIQEQSPGTAKAIEITYTVVPLLMVIGMFGLTIGYMDAMKEPKHKSGDLTVRVIGNRWYWEFEYPDYGVLLPDEFHIPVNTNVHLILESDDVIHSFWIPALGGKKDVIPGQTNEMWFRADKVGEDVGYCAEFCGTQHAKMRAKVIIDTPENFQKWISRMQQPPPQPQTPLQQQGYDMITTGICSKCHTLGMTHNAQMLGPDLAHMPLRTTFTGASAFNEDTLRHWLKDNQKMKPGNLMQGVNLTDPEINALVAYLLMDTTTTTTPPAASPTPTAGP